MLQVFRFIQNCLGWSSFVPIYEGLIRFRLDGSRSVQTVGGRLVDFGLNPFHALRAEQLALSLTGAAEVALVSIGIDARFPLVGKGAGVGLLLEFAGQGAEGQMPLLLLDLLEARHGAEQEPQFAGGGDVLAVSGRFRVGLREQVDLVGELVGGDGAEDVCAVEPVIPQVRVGGGAGAVHFLGHLAQGTSTAGEVVSFEDAQAASGSGRLAGGGWHVWFSLVYQVRMF